MGWRSTATIAILVFVVLFSMIYVSSSNVLGGGRNQAAEALQSTPNVSADISRMVNPENICFEVDQGFLDAYPPLVQGLKEADDWVEIDNSIGSHSGNYYSGVVLYLDRAQILSLVREYSGFNETAGKYTTPDNLFTYDQHNLGCGFVYQEKYYRIGITFDTLEQVHRDIGYVAVNITKALTIERAGSAAPSGITYAPFNNTLVFYNELSLPLTVQIISDDAIGLDHVVIPPDKMTALRLPASWSSPEDSVYEYKIVEYPWIKGNFTVSTEYTSECLDNGTAKSLYSHSGLQVKFPSYLLRGFGLACNAEIMSSHLVQIYVNQSAAEYYEKSGIAHSAYNPYPFYLFPSMHQAELKGIIQVHAQRHYLDDPHKILETNYEAMTDSSSANFEFYRNGGITYHAFYQDRLSVVDVAVDQEQYRIIGMLPMDEIMRVAESLS